LGRYFESIKHLQRAQRLSPGSAQVVKLLGRVYLKSGNQVQGEKNLQQAVTLDGTDVDSLFRLGRLAASGGRWSQAIVIYNDLSRREFDRVDAGLRPLIYYSLGNALMHEGYDGAGVEQLMSYLDLPLDINRTTRLVRELMVLQRQRGAMWVAIGDAYSRLGRAGDALLAYQRGVEAGYSSVQKLVSRKVYSQLQRGQLGLAVDEVAGYLGKSGADAVSLGLVKYLADQGVGRQELLGVLEEAYEGNGHGGAVVLAMAQLLETNAGSELLAAHLEDNPGDRGVYRSLMERLVLGPGVSVEQMSQGLKASLGVIGREPGLAQGYVQVLTDGVRDYEGILQAVELLGADDRSHAVIRYVKGWALARLGRIDEAVSELEQAAGQGGVVGAQVELAQVLLEAGEVDRAKGILDGLKDRVDRRVVGLRVRLLRGTGQDDEAVKLLAGLVEQYPLDVGLAMEMAKLYLGMNQVAKAEQALIKGLNQRPGAEELYEGLVDLYVSGRLPNWEPKYRRLIKQIMSTIPNTRVAKLERCRVLISGEQYDRAETLLRELLVGNAGDVKALDGLLDLMVRMDRVEQAQVLISQRLGESPEDQKLLGVALRHYRRAKDPGMIVEIAGRMLAKLMIDKPRDIALADRLVEMMSQAGGGAVAESELSEQLSHHPNDRGLLLLARRYYQREKDEARVLSLTERLLLLEPETAQRAQALGGVYLKQGQPKKTVEVLAGMIDDAGPNARIVVDLMARALTELGETAQADQIYKKAIERYAERGDDLTFDWAMHCERRGDKERAQTILGELLERAPNHAMANNALGYALANRGEDLEEAERMIKRAVSADANNAAYLDSMGWVYYKQGRFAESVKWLRRAESAGGGAYPVILDHLGDAYYRQGKPDDAVGVWGKAKQQLDKQENIVEGDPEIEGLNERLEAKIAEVKDGGEPGVAGAVEAKEVVGAP